MEPLHLARGLAVVNTALQASVIALVQRTYDEPRRVRRYATQGALAAGAGLLLVGSDAVWKRATRDRAPEVDPDVVPVHETMALIRQVGLASAWTPVWWFGRGLPDRLRSRGDRTPNASLALPLGLAYGASAAPLEWTQARERVAALTG